ncbi:uncharacterized protein LOC119163118 isoform X8 [Rhipicephalus microplus]|uniref:uncharacterized protein LOC119163118 isoform X8 n=1 Tax=Rhipicephalus microplus TaxID=6941 RepID=UPI003F6B540F
MLPDIAAKGSRVRRDRCSNLPVKHFVSRVASRLSAMPSGADDPAPPEHRTKHGLREFKDDIVLFFKTAYSYCTREDIWLLCLMILTSYSVRADLSADMKYAVNHQWFYMFATTFFVIAPVVFVGFLTRDWIIDKEDTCGRANYSDIVCGSLYRYWLAIDALRKANNNEDNDTFKQRRSDLQLFVLYMTLLKSAPQAVFQFYVKLDTDGWNTFTGCIAMCFYKLFEDSSFNTPVPFSRIIHKSEKKKIAWSPGWKMPFAEAACKHRPDEYASPIKIAVSAQLPFALESAQIIARAYVISWPKQTATRRRYRQLFPAALQHHGTAETSMKFYFGCGRLSLGSGDEHASISPNPCCLFAADTAVHWPQAEA